MTTTALRPTAPAAPRTASVGLVFGGILSQQFGAAVAAMVFPLAGALGVVALRLTISAVVMLAVCRPAVRGYRRADWAVVVVFGVALAVMNMMFYQAIARIPLGAAVTLEVLGPLVLSVVTSRRASSWLWAGLALVGVVLLGRGGFDGLDLVGTAFALGAGALWAAYIVCSARAGSRFPKADGLALAMAVSAVISLPLGLSGALFHPVTLALGAAVALLSSALPYTLELLSLRTLRQSTFAVLMSLAPAVAALAGYVVLGQGLALPDVAAIVLVVVAGIGAVRSAGR
ncbi:EamA family transporter [Umezawaea tangerina]|uniref:Inner membrane transporter RhtA n=1 Tax=Umezawaea tangerina TaxID=84725 RepID=A0A2T0SN04_9PSEU|nr:EamA family transporter [Umezawaea tangerina]PRY34776.1 inner membrane transporter RhtA [Umezawaea tangerina]